MEKICLLIPIGIYFALVLGFNGVLPAQVPKPPEDAPIPLVDEKTADVGPRNRFLQERFINFQAIGFAFHAGAPGIRDAPAPLTSMNGASSGIHSIVFLYVDDGSGGCLGIEDEGLETPFLAGFDHLGVIAGFSGGPTFGILAFDFDFHPEALMS